MPLEVQKLVQPLPLSVCVYAESCEALGLWSKEAFISPLMTHNAAGEAVLGHRVQNTQYINYNSNTSSLKTTDHNNLKN